MGLHGASGKLCSLLAAQGGEGESGPALSGRLRRPDLQGPGDSGFIRVDMSDGTRPEARSASGLALTFSFCSAQQVFEPAYERASFG